MQGPDEFTLFISDQNTHADSVGINIFKFFNNLILFFSDVIDM